MVAALRPVGLTHVQFVLLASAWWMADNHRDRPTQRGLAEHAGTDPMMTSQVLRGLESRGLVSREPDPDDSRARRIGVTPEGAALARAAITAVEAADDRFFSTTADRAVLIRTLRDLA
jgi:DNA-binding MarR family transcriptional regulator